MTVMFVCDRCKEARYLYAATLERNGHVPQRMSDPPEYHLCGECTDAVIDFIKAGATQPADRSVHAHMLGNSARDDGRPPAPPAPPADMPDSGHYT